MFEIRVALRGPFELFPVSTALLFFTRSRPPRSVRRSTRSRLRILESFFRFEAAIFLTPRGPYKATTPAAPPRGKTGSHGFANSVDPADFKDFADFIDFTTVATAFYSREGGSVCLDTCAASGRARPFLGAGAPSLRGKNWQSFGYGSVHNRFFLCASTAANAEAVVDGAAGDGAFTRALAVAEGLAEALAFTVASKGFRRRTRLPTNERGFRYETHGANASSSATAATIFYGPCCGVAARAGEGKGAASAWVSACLYICFYLNYCLEVARRPATGTTTSNNNRTTNRTNSPRRRRSCHASGADH